ncbi:MAG: EAL domain-containing protein [Gammaproteobacteria bacterium]|nr:EAL domain-containing protein [Gammaproteobacteria bacterium]
MSDFSQAIRFIEAMRQQGCRFALDDYGSGACSFSYLRNLPVDILKLDGELVLAMQDDEVAVAMVRSIVTMAKSMQMVCVAEYVKDATLLEQVRALDIEYAQGEHVGVVMPLSQALALLED